MRPVKSNVTVHQIKRLLDAKIVYSRVVVVSISKKLTIS